MAYLTSSSASQNALIQSIDHALERIALRIKRNRVYRQTFNELSNLSHRELADLGLDRSELRRVAQESADMTTH